MASQIKTIGQSGQISLGKEYAGRTVVVDNPEEGVWVIKTAQVIPDNELWLHQDPDLSKVNAGLVWAKDTPARATDLDEFENELRKQWEAKHDEPLTD